MATFSIVANTFNVISLADVVCRATAELYALIKRASSASDSATQLLTAVQSLATVRRRGAPLGGGIRAVSFCTGGRPVCIKQYHNCPREVRETGWGTGSAAGWRDKREKGLVSEDHGESRVCAQRGADTALSTDGNLSSDDAERANACSWRVRYFIAKYFSR
jgi:hypothetical protein